MSADLHRVWLGIAAAVWHRPPGRLERVLSVMLRSPGLARALLATPSLVLPWILASAAAFASGVLASLATGTALVPLLAPAVAAAGIACAYGPGVDPAYELTRTMAVSDRMVLLVRVPAVFGTNAVLGLLASLASVHAVAITFGWLIPMAAMSALALAVATVTRSAPAGVAAGLAAWCITVLSARAASGRYEAALGLTLPYLACTIICAVVVLISTNTPAPSKQGWS